MIAKKLDGKKKLSHGKLAGIIATVLWTVGIILTIAIPAGSRYVFLGDSLLLIGFWPLLWVWRPGWPWIIFGVLNVFIGFFLEIAYHLPETNFTHEMIVVRNHLRDQHSSLAWILIGFASAIFGVVRTIKQITMWIIRRTKAGKTNSDATDIT